MAPSIFYKNLFKIITGARQKGYWPKRRAPFLEWIDVGKLPKIKEVLRMETTTKNNSYRSSELVSMALEDPGRNLVMAGTGRRKLCEVLKDFELRHIQGNGRASLEIVTGDCGKFV